MSPEMAREGALTRLDEDAVRTVLKARGVVEFRGFGASLEDFRVLAGRFASRFVYDLGLSKESPTGHAHLQAVNTQGNAQDPHRENGRIGDAPDLLWFFCERPAAEGGETVLCDGIALWKALPPGLQDRFLSRKLRFSGRRVGSMRRAVLEFVLQDLEDKELTGLALRFTEPDLMMHEWVAPAVTRTRWGDALAFCNSITGPYGGAVEFEDGSPMTEEIIGEIRAAQARALEKVALAPGELLMIDNSRFLHGRTAFADTKRRLFTIMSKANF
jgi:hypothetical protein